MERYGFAGAYVTDLQVPTSRILDAEVAGSGVTDLQGRWWFLIEDKWLVTLGWRFR